MQGVAVAGPDRGRLRSLDALRGVAVLMVMATHAPWPASAARGPLGRLTALGAYGVDLFFVLSGFLISGLLLAEVSRTGRLDMGRFWLRRGLKIWPSYYVAYGVAALATAAGGAAGAADLLPNLAFVQNYVRPEGRWPMSWSLAVEEHFYLALPVVMSLLLATRAGLRALPWLCGLVVAVVPVLRCCGTCDPALLYIQTHYRADALAIGVLLGCLHAAYPRLAGRLAAAWPLALAAPLLALAPLAVLPFEGIYARSAGLTLLSLSYAALVGLAAGRPDGGAGPVRRLVGPLARVGVYSYTIYLMQHPADLAAGAYADAIRGLLAPLGATAAWRAARAAQFSLFVGVSLLGGVGLSWAVERPSLRLRDRWVPSRRPAGRPAIPAPGWAPAPAAASG